MSIELFADMNMKDYKLRFILTSKTCVKDISKRKYHKLELKKVKLYLQNHKKILV
jgi:hypothetical protein